MPKQKIFFICLIAVVLTLMPAMRAEALYNTVVWGPDARLSFAGVAPVSDGVKGITIQGNGTTRLHSYVLDLATLKVTMYPRSELHLKSADRKMFRTSIATTETVCADGYSTFDYSTPETYATFTITFADGDNCPAVVKTEAPTSPAVEQIDITNLDRITSAGLVKKLGQNSKTHFVFGNIVETVEILTVGATETKVKLSAPAKELNLKINKEKTVDTDADGWNDLNLILKSTAGGQAELSMKQMSVIKINGVNPGELVKVAGGTTVYYVGADSKLYVFPNEKVYYSWHEDFSAVKIISSADLAKFGWGGLVTYRPGIKLVKFSISPAVYSVAQGGVLRKLKDENMAKEMYGDNWNKQIDDVNEAFIFSYTFGDGLKNVGDYNSSEASQLTPNIRIDKGI